MKIKIEYTVEIDQEAYALVYGCEMEEVREQVKDDARFAAVAHFEAVGVLSK
tara:strand:- start:859 stop:1014 length:156 start_codon:yes stop_codon:yes gene_type:complete